MNKTNMAAPSMGFTPEDMKSISSVLGYTGEPSGFANYLSQNPQAHDSFMGIQQQRTQFNNGGFVATQHMANGGYAGDRAYGRNPYGNQAIGGPGINQKQEDYIRQNIDPNDGYYREPGRFHVMPGPNTPPPDPDLYYDNLLPTLEARGLIDKTGPFIREGDRDQFGNPTEYTYEQSKQLNFRNEQQNDMFRMGMPKGVGQQVYNTGNTSQQLPQQQQSTIDNLRFDPQAGNITPYPMPTQDAPTSRGEQNLANVQAPRIGAETASRLQDPAIPAAAIYSATQTPTEAAQLVNPATAQLTGDVTIGQAGQAQTSQGAGPDAITAASVTAAQAAPDVRDLAAQTVASQKGSPTKAISAAQQAGAGDVRVIDTAVSQLQGAQTAGAQVQAPTPRQLQAGETIAAPRRIGAKEAGVEQVNAAVATPSSQATVQGQLASLISEFTDTEVPLWARGAVDNARAVLMQRGIGASSMAGQAIVEAAMRAALPIAQVDAATVAGFEQANLSNRQQAAMVSAQYRAQFMQQEFDQGFQTRVQNAARIGDIANANFSSAQQIALENAKLAQTTDLNNLNNKQALVMANAAQVAGLEATNLNNRQQAAVQNAQNFLQLDVANLSNSQQTSLFNAQQRGQSILSDTAAENAAKQLNATSQMQTDQFFANLTSQVSQQNSAQSNAINQFNAGEINTLQRFNSEIVNQRDQFNAQNQLAIEQSNAQWRKSIATTDTAAVNFQNQLNAQNVLDVSNTAYNNMWQEYRDVMEWAWTSTENEAERYAAMTVAQINAKARSDLAEYTANREDTKGIFGFVGDLFKPVLDFGVSKVFPGSKDFINTGGKKGD